MIITPEQKDIEHFKNQADEIFDIELTDAQVKEMFKDKNLACHWAWAGDDDGDEIFTKYFCKLLGIADVGHPSFLTDADVEKVKAVASAKRFTIKSRV